MSPVKIKRNFCRDIDFSECDEDVFGEYMYTQMHQPPIDLDSLNETVERKMQLMEC